MRSTQWQLGTWEPAQHLLENRGEPKKKKKTVETSLDLRDANHAYS